MSKEITSHIKKEDSPTYWRSFRELKKDPVFSKEMEREFVNKDPSTLHKSSISRRKFLSTIGASVALAGLASCRRPIQKILPYSKQPENVVPGIPLLYATSMPFQDTSYPLLIENHEGRPTKVEGNISHPSSDGSTNIYHQASILDMYDPERSRFIRNNDTKSSLSALEKLCQDISQNTNQRIAILSEETSSITFYRLKEALENKYPNITFHFYEPFSDKNVLNGIKKVFGTPLRPHYRMQDAELIVSFDDDFLNPAMCKNHMEYTSGYAQARRVNTVYDTMCRMYMVESHYSLTGSNADHRLRLKPSLIPIFIYTLAHRLSDIIPGLEAFSTYRSELVNHPWINILIDELTKRKGRSVLTAGYNQPEAVHATIAAINVALNNVANTVYYLQVPFVNTIDSEEHGLKSVMDKLSSRSIDTLLILGCNPVYSAPNGKLFADLMAHATTIHLSDYYNETSEYAKWHINKAHFLESWGDVYSYNGIRSIVQPQIQPLFGGISTIELLNMFITGKYVNGYDLVKETWKPFYLGAFEQNWNRCLHDGYDRNQPFRYGSSSVKPIFRDYISYVLRENPPERDIEIVIKPDNKIYDGRYANNGWLQEMPDPITKITWHNVGLMSSTTASTLQVKNEDIISINHANKEIKMSVWIQPGHADDSITVFHGYGRTKGGSVSSSVGNKGQILWEDDMSNVLSNLNIQKLGISKKIACVQDHHSMEGRKLVRETSLDTYKTDPFFASYKNTYGYDVPGIKEAQAKEKTFPVTLFKDQTYPEREPQWGMTIDLNSCIGCSVCVVACQAENNIPVIGETGVQEGREMHWIRVDRYYVGNDTDNPKAVFQPIPCMHCELAPCEQVCPVAATTHSDDGMNQMTYNRCVGTRYCANNCPYKVRRFNFFNYAKTFLREGKDPEVRQMAMNPDVTIRFRGVMEKCTYCVQRVNRAKIETKVKSNNKSVKPPDGMVKTACQQACPTQAISFGDITDKNSVVSKFKQNSRNYTLLEELNIRPRTTYLAKLRNTNTRVT